MTNLIKNYLMKYNICISHLTYSYIYDLNTRQAYFLVPYSHRQILIASSHITKNITINESTNCIFKLIDNIFFEYHSYHFTIFKVTSSKTLSSAENNIIIIDVEKFYINQAHINTDLQVEIKYHSTKRYINLENYLYNHIDINQLLSSYQIDNKETFFEMKLNEFRLNLKALFTLKDFV